MNQLIDAVLERFAMRLILFAFKFIPKELVKSLSSAICDYYRDKYIIKEELCQ